MNRDYQCHGFGLSVFVFPVLFWSCLPLMSLSSFACCLFWLPNVSHLCYHPPWCVWVEVCVCVFPPWSLSVSSYVVRCLCLLPDISVVFWIYFWISQHLGSCLNLFSGFIYSPVCLPHLCLKLQSLSLNKYHCTVKCSAYIINIILV